MPRRVRTTFSAVGLRLVVGCFVLFGLTMLGLGPGMVSAADATPATTSPSSEQTLADRYAPIVVVRQHSTPCGDGEPYLPVSVSAVLGRPGVTLRGPDGQVVKSAPTAADLAGKGGRVGILCCSRKR